MRHFRTSLSMSALALRMFACPLIGALIPTASALQRGSTSALAAVVAAKLVAAITTSTDQTDLATEPAIELSGVVFEGDCSRVSAGKLTLIRPACDLEVDSQCDSAPLSLVSMKELAATSFFACAQIEIVIDSLDSGQES